jgi:hypothetical protein
VHELVCVENMKNRDEGLGWLETLEGYQHSLFIIRYKHRRYHGGLLMANYIGIYTRSQKRIKMTMETTICLYNKGNESSLDACFCVGLCVLLNDNYCYMHCHRQSTLYQICMSWIDNDNIHQGLKTSLVMIISIRLYVWQGKRWGTSFCTWAPLSDTTNTITSQNVSWATMHSLSHMQCNKWIPKSLMIWPHLYHERCATIRCDIWKQICNVVKRW